MWFHFFIGNHDQTGRMSLFDPMEWVVGSLKALKHEVTIGDTIAPNALNIIWENFGDADEQIFRDANFKFGLVATEIPIGKTYNWLDQEPWLTRRRAFEKIAPRAQFIWSLVEQPVKDYAQLAPSAFLELGFLESMVDPVFALAPRTDFGFYGQHITSYRMKVLDGLRKHFPIAMPDRFLTGRDLNEFIASFRVGICLKHSPEWPIPSPGRIGRLLHARRGIAAEYVPMPTRISALAAIAEPGADFAEFCLDYISGPWKQRAGDAYERFRAAAPMTQIMQRLLDETVSTSSTSSRLTNLVPVDNGARVQIAFAQQMPELIASERGYNFVRYLGRVYALARSIGPVDLRDEAGTLADRFGSKAVIVADTIEAARDQVTAALKTPASSN